MPMFLLAGSVVMPLVFLVVWVWAMASRWVVGISCSSEVPPAPHVPLLQLRFFILIVLAQIHTHNDESELESTTHRSLSCTVSLLFFYSLVHSAQLFTLALGTLHHNLSIQLQFHCQNKGWICKQRREEGWKIKYQSTFVCVHVLHCKPCVSSTSFEIRVRL